MTLEKICVFFMLALMPNFDKIRFQTKKISMKKCDLDNFLKQIENLRLHNVNILIDFHQN